MQSVIEQYLEEKHAYCIIQIYNGRSSQFILTLMDLLCISCAGSMASLAGCMVRHSHVLTKGQAATSSSSS
jgi:hypothetical protein